jgi:hypothetical protein
MKNSNNTIGKRTRDLPACVAVPQPTAPRRAPYNLVLFVKFTFSVMTQLLQDEPTKCTHFVTIKIMF